MPGGVSGCNAGTYLMIRMLFRFSVASKFAFVDYTALKKQDLASTVRE